MTTDNPQELWRIQLALECKAFDAGRLVPVPCADPDPLPTGYAVRYRDDSAELAFAAAAPDWFADQIGRHSIDGLIDRPEALAKQFQAEGHHIEVGHFHTYRFDENTAAQQQAVTNDGPEVYSIVIDDRAVAGASSSRSNNTAAELWIETDPAHRRRGYATILAQAWASSVQRGGKIAFYSHLHDNTASAALARHLGLSPLFEIIAIDLK